MGIEVYEVDRGPLTSVAVIVCNTSNRPLALPLFDSIESAEGFLEYARGLHFDDVRRLTADALEQLHTTWIKAGQPAAKDDDEGADEEIEVVGVPW